MRRSLHQACQAMREWTGWKPGLNPIDSSRTATTVATANSASARRVAGTDHSAARRTSSPALPASRMPHATSARAASRAASGIAPSATADSW